MPTDISIQPGQRVEVSLPQWLTRDKGLKSREIAGEVLRVTPKAIQVRAHAIVRYSDHCMVCGREIENFISRHCGYGPICAENLGLPRPENLNLDEIEAIRERIYRETEVECWLPLSQVVIRSVTGEPAATAFPNDPARAGLEALLAGRTDEAEAALAAVQQPTPPTSAPNPRRIIWDDGMYRVLFPYNPDLVQAVKRIPGYKWDNANKRWSFPATAGADLLRFAAEHGFEVDEAAARQAHVLREAEELNLAESRASEADYQVDGLGGTLMPFQAAGVRYGARQRRLIIGDQPGLGKTIQFLALVQATQAYPALMVPPATLKINWRMEAAKWLPGRKVVVLEGKKPQPIPADADFVVINYDILHNWVEILEETTGRSRRPQIVGAKGPLTAHGFRALGFDEGHLAKSHKALRTRALKAVSVQMVKDVGLEQVVLADLTGTPVLNKPEELISPLEILHRLDDLGGWYYFATRYCGFANGVMGSVRVSPEALEELNERMRAVCYIRRLKKDVLKELPDKVRSTIPLQLDGPSRRVYDRAERDLVGFVRENAGDDRRFRASIAGLGEDEKKEAIRERQDDKAFSARQAEALVRVNVLKQVAAKGKMAGVLEWVRTFLESGEKLVIGAWHQEVVETIAHELGAPYIHGDVDLAERDRIVDRFQRCAGCGVRHDKHDDDPRACGEYQPDMRCPVVVLNTKSGGVGLTLTAASDLAVVELPWTPGELDQLEDRIHRIGQKDTANIWYLLAQNTIDEDVAALIDGKRVVVDGATDGQGREESASIMQDLMKRLRARQGAGDDAGETEA